GEAAARGYPLGIVTESLGARDLPQILTHYYRSFSKPLLSISALSVDERATVLAALQGHEPLPFRLAEPEYFPERQRIEKLMRTQFAAKGGRPRREQPHYFVLGTFSLWEADGSSKFEIPLASVPSDALSFTMTDSFFNYRRENLRGIRIPERPYHGQLFTLADLPEQIERHGLPGEAWRSDPTRIFDVYVEAQLWSEVPLP
ncbi:MAG: hypothetical protein ACRETX_13840, partial [Steroidobacteraceae bacterium]